MPGMKLLFRWLISTVTLMVVAHFVQGFHVNGFVAALLAALVLGLVNATLGSLMRLLTLPLTFLTLGLFLIVVNAVMLKVAAYFTPGFTVDSWKAALIGAICVSVISGFLHWIIGDKRQDERRQS
jgi:putative membrane protein